MCLSWLTHFNSIKVRLELVVMSLNETLHSYFNSIKVRLEPVGGKEHVKLNLSDFNSIKVRLERPGCEYPAGAY